MLEFAILGVFTLALTICLALGQTILYALTFGFFLFFAYGLYKMRDFFAVLKLCFEGILTVLPVMKIFVLIGALTATWYICGTVPVIVHYGTMFFSAKTMIISSFLLCCFVSVLTGTSFGTVATMGVICATTANTMGVSPVYMGGAILSGIYFGDRISPVSSSALLVAQVTGTNNYANIKNMIPSTIVPFCLTCALYFALGFISQGGAQGSNAAAIFEEFFVMSGLAVAPAAAILLLSIFRLPADKTLSLSIFVAILVAIFVQNEGISEIVKVAIFGYHPDDAELSKVLSGGGIISMLNMMALIIISSCYAGIFRGTGFLDGIRAKISGLSAKITPFGVIVLCALVTTFISCSQALAVILTNQLCDEIGGTKEEFAVKIENSCIVISAIVPWSIAASIPLAAIGSPSVSVLFASYLYLLPICTFFSELKHKRVAIR